MVEAPDFSVTSWKSWTSIWESVVLCQWKLYDVGHRMDKFSRFCFVMGSTTDFDLFVCLFLSKSVWCRPSRKVDWTVHVKFLYSCQYIQKMLCCKRNLTLQPKTCTHLQLEELNSTSMFPGYFSLPWPNCSLQYLKGTYQKVGESLLTKAWSDRKAGIILDWK